MTYQEVEKKALDRIMTEKNVSLSEARKMLKKVIKYLQEQDPVAKAFKEANKSPMKLYREQMNKLEELCQKRDSHGGV